MALVYLNPTKRLRAIDQLKKEAVARGEKGFVPTEDQIRDRYVSFGGALTDEVVNPNPPTVEERLARIEDHLFNTKTVEVKKAGRPRKVDVDVVA